MSVTTFNCAVQQDKHIQQINGKKAQLAERSVSDRKVDGLRFDSRTHNLPLFSRKRLSTLIFHWACSLSVVVPQSRERFAMETRKKVLSVIVVGVLSSCSLRILNIE